MRNEKRHITAENNSYQRRAPRQQQKYASTTAPSESELQKVHINNYYVFIYVFMWCKHEKRFRLFTMKNNLALRKQRKRRNYEFSPFYLIISWGTLWVFDDQGVTAPSNDNAVIIKTSHARCVPRRIKLSDNCQWSKAFFFFEKCAINNAFFSTIKSPYIFYCLSFYGVFAI